MLSIIIPTHNRAESVSRSLLALDKQKCDESFEVVLVQDGCKDRTDEVVQALRVHYPIRHVRLPGLGAAAARNAGASAASERLLLFMDDDIVPHPGMLDAHFRKHESSKNTAVVGPCPYGPELLVNPIDFHVRDWWKRRYEILSDPGHVFTFYDCLTGNLSMPRQTFESAGGFDNGFLKDGREDYEFGVRLLALGVKLAYAPDAVGYHYPTNNPKSLLNKWFTFGRADVYFARKHPDILDSSPLRRYWTMPSLKRRSISMCLSLAGKDPKRLLNLLGNFFERRLDQLWSSNILGYWYVCQQMAYMMGAVSTGHDLRDLKRLANGKWWAAERARVPTRIEDIHLDRSLAEIKATSGLRKIVMAPRLGDKILGWTEANCHAGEVSLPCKEITDCVTDETFWDAWRETCLSQYKGAVTDNCDLSAWTKFEECIRTKGSPRQVCLSASCTFRRPEPVSMSLMVFGEANQQPASSPAHGMKNMKCRLIDMHESGPVKRLLKYISKEKADYILLLRESDRVDPGWMAAARETLSKKNVDCMMSPVLLRDIYSRGNELYQTFADFDRVRYWPTCRITDRFSLAHIMYDFPVSNHRMIFRRKTLKSILTSLSGSYSGFDDLMIAVFREALLQYKQFTYEPRALLWSQSPQTPEAVRRMASRHAYLVSKEIASILVSGGPGRLRALAAISKVPRIQIRRLYRSARSSIQWPVSYAIGEIIWGIRGTCRGLIPSVFAVQAGGRNKK